MRISGLTIARRVVDLKYPFEESLRSLLPLVDELIVNVGDDDEETWEAVQKLADPKIIAFRSVWDLTKRDGLALSEETNKALAKCGGDWAVYLQADEVLHEDDLPALRAAMQANLTTGVEAFSLLYYHFYGSFDLYQDDPRRWYRRATRIVRLGQGIVSAGDACAFLCQDREAWRQPRRRRLGARVYHYGHVRPPHERLRKQRNLERMYHDEQWLAHHRLPLDEDPRALYTDTRHLRVFTGRHPAVMRARLAAVSWSPPVRPVTRWPEWLRRLYVYSGWVAGRVTGQVMARLRNNTSPA